MPFPFAHVCDLLDQIQQRRLPVDRAAIRSIVASWFTKHRRSIDHSRATAPALFSTLLPDTRTDRVYGIQAPSLQRIIGRAFCLGSSRFADLRRYERPGSGEDLADCVANILTETPNPVSRQNAVTVEGIDALLNGLAARCYGSREDLGQFYLHLDAREAKWLTRIILKNIQLTMLDPSMVYGCYDSRLPVIAKVQEDFDVALASLWELKAGNPLGIGRQNLIHLIKPTLGTKVGRQTWLKGRSIKHCLDIHPKRISCEKKMDGEYCQIHVDLSKGSRSIKIFSKSGKDSTRDRVGVHQAIWDSLGIGSSIPKISKGCILEAELLAYNDNTGKILPFHKIRKYVPRSGVLLGAQQDSPPDPDEHLMIVYFDVLLIDDESLLGCRQTERFTRLRNLITCRIGHAQLVSRHVIDLDQRRGASDLRRAFAESITHREEGLVLKPDDPYFDFSESRRPFAGCPIKLKKEYIGNFGDVGDFAVVGARYDSVKAKEYSIPGLKWTHFFLGCLTNKDDVQRFQVTPSFTVIDEVVINATMLGTVVVFGNPIEVPLDKNNIYNLNIPARIANGKMPTVIFQEPLVFDIRCFSFEKPGNTGFWIPRFPQVSKVHFDRTYMDTITFTELQAVAEDARTVPVMEDSQEMLHWINLLEGADPRGVPVDYLSQSTVSSMMTPSPGRPCRASQLSSVAPPEAGIIAPHLPPSRSTKKSALATPPTSSPTSSPTPGEPPNVGKDVDKETYRQEQGSEAEGAKRSHHEPDIDSAARKRPKISAAPGSVPSPQLASSRSTQNHRRSGTHTREPLSGLSINSSPVRTRLSKSFSQQPARKENHWGATLQNMSASFPALTIGEAPSSKSLVPLTRSTKAAPITLSVAEGGCQYAGRRCIMRNRVYLLAPCIANQVLITENLLPVHGIKSWTTDPKDWRHDELVHVTTTAQSMTALPHRRRRKVCFVERRRAKATQDLISQIQQLNLRLPGGERELVEIYDWRVLEHIDQYEKSLRGSTPRGAQPNPWKKWWVGLV